MARCTVARLMRLRGVVRGREVRTTVSDPAVVCLLDRVNRKFRSAGTVDWLPRYAPKLDLIEATWRDLKHYYLAHCTFRDANDPDQAIHQAIAALNEKRSSMHPCDNLPKAA